MEATRWSDTFRWIFAGREGAAGRVVSSSILAGGISGGGLLIGTLALTGRGNPGLHLLLAPVLFLAGSLAGLLLGLLVGVWARPGDVPRSDALKRGALAAAMTVPLVPVSWLLSSSITVGTALQVEQRTSWVVVSTVGAALGLAVCFLAARELSGVLREAVRRRGREGTGGGRGASKAGAPRYTTE